MKSITFGKFGIGKDFPCFFIAEAGVNHNGSLDLAKKLVDAAIESGADAVKFQTFTAEKVVTSDASMCDYQVDNTGKQESQLEMIKKFELPLESFKELKSYCDEKGILFLSTPHSADTVDFLDELVPIHKIGSGDITNFPLLRQIARKGKPILISTGMAAMEEIEEAVNVIKAEGNEQVIVLHCTTNYPCPLDQVNLNAMTTIRNKTGCLVGYSDHTDSIMTSYIAVSLGARVIEKHFTLNKHLPGPDHKASLDPGELKEMIEKTRLSEKVLGSFEKKPTMAEIEILKVVRKSIVSNKFIPQDTVITEDMLTIKRPASGIEPRHLSKVVGKTALKDIEIDTLISWEDLKET